MFVCFEHFKHFKHFEHGILWFILCSAHWVRFEYNLASKLGGAIALSEHTAPYFRGCHFVDNQVTSMLMHSFSLFVFESE